MSEAGQHLYALFQKCGTVANHDDDIQTRLEQIRQQALSGNPTGYRSIPVAMAMNGYALLWNDAVLTRIDRERLVAIADRCTQHLVNATRQERPFRKVMAQLERRGFPEVRQ